MKAMRLVLMAGVMLVAGAVHGQAPLLLRMSFNDEAGSPSLANRG